MSKIKPLVPRLGYVGRIFFFWGGGGGESLAERKYSEPGGGHSTFFQEGVCGPDFRLRTDICLWKGGLVRGKFPNLGACELKISKFGALWAKNFQILWAKIWVKIEQCWGKNFQISQKGVLWTDSLICLKWDPCERQERHEKGVFRAAHPHTPLLGQCPPPPDSEVWTKDLKLTFARHTAV